MKNWIKRALMPIAAVIFSYCMMVLPTQAAASDFFPTDRGVIKGYCYRVKDVKKRNVYVYLDERCLFRNEKEYIDAITDECYIVRISATYNNVLVSYPTSKGRKERWVTADSFTTKLSAKKRYATGTIRTYKFAASSTTYGSISQGDLVYVYETVKSRTRVIYPVSGGYKIA